MSPSSDALANPTQAIGQLYFANKAQGTDTFPRTVADHFKKKFASPHALAEIPTLDLGHPPQSFSNGSLVVFNCMIQDTSISPELYLSTLKNGGCGGWGITDDLSSEDDVRYTDLRECSVFWGVSVPGLSSWCYGESGQIAAHPAQPHKYPIPNAPHIGVQIKIYDESLARPLRTTDLVSFIGILSSESLHASLEVSEHRNVPTLHVLFSNSIPTTILQREYPEPSIFQDANTIRDELIAWLADESLGGDRVVAEWVLLCAIARVRSRHPPVLPLSMTVANFPAHADHPDSKPVLSSVLSLIFPLLTSTSLSLENLNKDPFCPESTEEDLHSGLLQLPKGTVLIMDEGAVTEGGISNRGVTNIRVAQEMMKSQTLDYVFPYSSFHFETDVSFMILTEGKKSTFFQTDVTVSLQQASSDGPSGKFYKPADAIKLPPPEKLLQFRQLIGGAKVGNVVVGEATGKYIEEDFVRERSASTDKKSSLTSDDLIRRMLIARLKALLSHQTEVTIKHWESAKALDQYAM